MAETKEDTDPDLVTDETFRSEWLLEAEEFFEAEECTLSVDETSASVFGEIFEESDRFAAKTTADKIAVEKTRLSFIVGRVVKRREKKAC